MKKIFFSVLMCSCSAAGADPYPFQDVEVKDEAVIISPDWGMEYATNEAVLRWQEAACIDIVVADGGTRVFVATAPDEPMYCETEPGVFTGCMGGYNTRTDVIRIAGDITNNYDAVVGIVVHEIGHRLGAFTHVPDGLGEIMNLHSFPTTDKIGPESLNLVCAEIECGCYNPEKI